MWHTVVERVDPDGTLTSVQISRRAILVATVLSVAACGKHPKPVPPAPVVNPDAAALLTAQGIERGLLATYNHRIKHASAHEKPGLEVALTMHTAHLEALHGTAGTATTGTAPAVHPLKAVLRSSAATLRGLSLAAIDWTNAALFASIAASHETSTQ
jgi:predicted small lipoprotein YifL